MVEATDNFKTDEKQIEKWKVKRLIKSLDEAKGNGTSFVSLYIPPKETIVKISQMLGQELAGADNIKSRQTRQSVQSAITSCKEKLKLYKSTPENGLCIFCGIIMMEDGKSEKKIMVDIEPFKPINIFTYKC
jgi:peptide chain release factor subunit 1